MKTATAKSAQLVEEGFVRISERGLSSPLKLAELIEYSI